MKAWFALGDYIRFQIEALSEAEIAIYKEKAWNISYTFV